MALIIEDRVKETSTSTGTGAFTLAGAVTGFKAFSSVCTNADTLYYTIQGVDGSGSPTAEWEVGVGSWGTGGVLTRSFVLSSSNANTSVNFSAGDKEVWIDVPASQIKSFSSSSVTDFTSSGTYTVPSTAKFVEVHAYGAGGGGGSGFRGAAGILRTGGAGGGGGALVIRRFKVSELVFPVTVTIGAGGVGGAAVTTDNMVGNNGSGGGNSTFGSYVTSYGGGGGLGATGSAVSGGGGGGSASSGSGATGGAPLITTATGTSQQFGGGSGANSSAAGKNSVYGGGGGGNADTTNGAAGYSMYSGGGGGGGAGINTSNQLVGTQAAGGTGYTASANTSSQLNINGAAGAAFTGGQGGSIVLLNTSLSFTQVAFGDSKFVALSTAAGTGNYYIATSSDGTSGWDIQPLPTAPFAPTNHFHDGTRWVFYGATQIYTSVDLVNFTLRVSPSSTVNYVHFASGLYVAVGDGGLISTSTDLTNWTTRASGTPQSLIAATYNGTKWFVVGAGGVTLSSSDASSWTLVTLAGAPFLYAVTANGNTVVVHTSASPFARYSLDAGVTWNPVATVLLSSSASSNKTLIYSGGQFVMVAGSSVYTSADGITWTTQTDGTTDIYSGITSNGTTYVVGSTTANSNVGISSVDAITWNARTFTDSRVAASGRGGAGGVVAGGGGGAAAVNGINSGAGGNGGDGFMRVYAW